MASSGNFATLNPLVKYSIGTFSNGNLTYASGSDDGYTSTIDLNFKSYCEVRVDAISSSGGTIGFRGATDEDEYFDVVSFQENFSSGKIYHYKGNSSQSVSTADIGGTVSAGNIVMMAYDPATYKWWVGVNGTWRNSGDPANGTGFVFQGSATMFENMGSIHWGAWNGTNTHTITFNFGQDSTFGGQETAGGNADGNGFGDFKYSVPTGFLATCSGNIAISDDIDPAQTDDDYPSKQAGAVLYTGNGGSNAISGLGFQPDLVWGKCRSHSQAGILIDSSRGQGLLFSSLDWVEQTSNGPFMTSYDSDGFTLASSGSNPNDSGRTYVAWCFRANGGTATATITESGNNPGAVVQANPKGGFSIITYTGTGGAGTIAHGLDSAPTFMIIKNRGVADPWAVYHIGTDASAPATKYLVLNTNAAVADDATYWNDTAPTSSVLTVGTNHSVNADGENYVAYVWAPVEGMQKFGTYEGNGNADGAFIYTGFRPRLLAVKKTSGNDNWIVIDSERETFNAMGEKVLMWDDAGAEFDPANVNLDFVSNGVKMRNTDGKINASGADYIYMAWGDVPFKYNNTF